MRIFYSTCAAGLENIAAHTSGVIKGFQPLATLSGALIYRSAESNPNMPCFQNTYLMLARYDGVKTVQQAARRASKDIPLFRHIDQALHDYRFHTCRVMFSERNTLASIAPELRRSLERGIHSAKIDRMKPETELLLLTRSEGFSLVLLRLTRHAIKDAPAQGELAPGIAWCMARLAYGGPSGVFLDPFAGHGSLGQARSMLGGGRIMLSDKDPALVNALKKKFPGGRAYIAVQDALTLSERHEKGSITELVTDPPWGNYQQLPMPAKEFYDRMLGEFRLIMAPTGRLVVLTSDKERFEAALLANGFELRGRHDLLVNGKKAAIFLAHPPR